jgi:hypothetical protein
LRQNAATNLLQFVAFCCLYLNAFHVGTPYSSSKRGFCVREVVAVWTRNVRAIARPAVRGLVQSATASSPKTVHVRAPTVSATSPQLCPGHARRGVRGQSMAVAVAGP